MSTIPPRMPGLAVIYLTVFVTGAAVMVIELLGTRLIAPFYGTSLYVWSSLISVTMIALATGYFAGGRLADRAKHLGLAAVVSLAGLLTLLIPWLTRPVLLATDPLGLRTGAFTSALALFFLPLAVLGMTGPLAIKLATSRLDGVGSSAGSVYAVSTVGSVVGTLLLGFFLFPLVGSREILGGVGGALLVLGLGMSFLEGTRRSFLRGAASPSILLALAGLPLLLLEQTGSRTDRDLGDFKVRSERESLYGWVRVIDDPKRDLRLLTSDASTIGAANISDGETRLAYQDIVGLVPSLLPGVRRALLIGQGAGHMAMALRHKQGIATDTIEIDPAVAAAASVYFGFAPTGNTRIGDARYVVRHLDGPYDLIIHDCFTGGSEPAHLLTVEALSQIRALLSKRGILALNFVAFADGGRNAALASVARTLTGVFPTVRVFQSEPGNDFNDFIFLASNEPIDLNSGHLDPQQAGWIKERLIAVDVAAGTVLTDDLNPMELLQTRKAEHYRQLLVTWFGTNFLAP